MRNLYSHQKCKMLKNFTDFIDKLNSQKSSLESNIKDIEADISRRVSNI